MRVELIFFNMKSYVTEMAHLDWPHKLTMFDKAVMDLFEDNSNTQAHGQYYAALPDSIMHEM